MLSKHLRRKAWAKCARAHIHRRQSQRINQGNHRNVTKVLLMLIVYMSYHRMCWFGFFCQKSCQLLSYKSDTCTRVFIQIVVLQPLETALVRTNYKLSEAKPRIHVLFVRTKAASNGYKRTLWKKKRVQVYLTYTLLTEKNRFNNFDIYM